MRLFIAAKKILGGNETGVTLFETLVALALLGLIATVFLSGLATASKATFIADERATAESLARSQMEYVKSQDYVEAPWLYEAGYNGYTVNVTAELLDGHGTDDGIQKIRVTVEHDGESVLTVEGYKVDRIDEEE